MIALIGLLSAGLLMPRAVQANPAPYPSVTSTELPTLTVQAPEPSSPFYANNTLELNFNVTTPQSWNSYYLSVPTVGLAQIFVYLDGVSKQVLHPGIQQNFDVILTSTVVFANLTQQQHTAWIDVYCYIYGDGYDASVSQTSTFTIDSQEQTIAFHEDPVATTRPGTQSTVPPSPPPPTATPTSTPTPTVPEVAYCTLSLALIFGVGAIIVL